MAPAEFASLTAGIHDWRFFLEQVSWHRVAAHVLTALVPVAGQVPAATMIALRDMHHHQSRLALSNGSALKQLSVLLSGARIAFLVLKGLPLAQTLYGDPVRRYSKDIDILVRAEDLPRTLELLVASGFQQLIPDPGLSRRNQAQFRFFCKDATLRMPSTGASLELHWRLDTNPFALPASRFDPFGHAEPCPWIEGGLQLGLNANVLYLLVHASHSCTGRLSWLKDIAVLMARDDVNWDWICRQLQTLRLETAGWTILLLAHELLGASLPAATRQLPGPGWRVRFLIPRFKQSLLEGRYPGGWADHLQRLLLCSRLDYVAFHLLYRVGLSINDVLMLPLPRPLFPLYFVLRPLLWGWRRLPGNRANFVSARDAVRR